MVFYISPVQAADITCPATDDGTGYDSGASGDGEITINANATWTMPSGAVGDVWDCSLLDIVVTNNSTLTLVGSTTSGAYPYLQVIDLTVDSGSSISGDAKGCTTNGTGYGSMHPNTSTNVCTDTTDTTTQGGGAGTQGGASVGGGGGANGGSGGRSENNANPDLLGGTRYGSAYFTAPLYGSTGGEGDGQLGGKGGGVIRLEMSGTFTHNGVVTADGALGASDGGDRNGGGGAGGTIHIVTGTIAGSTGVFGAAGAAGQSPSAKASGGGGGGRIYVGYDTSTFTFSGSVIDASGGAAAGSALGGGDGTALVEDVDDDQVTVFDHFYHSDDDSGEYDNAETWTFDSTSTGECISGTATPDIGKQSVGNVANLTFGGTFTCTETSITNVNFYADTSFALATSTSITVAQKEADIDFTIPDNQTWTNVTITGPEAGRFFIDDAITIELAGTTSVAANPYWENLTGVTIGSSAEIDVSGKGCFDVATDGGSISGTTDGEAYADDGTFTCVKAGTGAGIGAGTGSGGIGSGGGGYGGAGGAGDGRNTDAAGGGTHGSNTAPLRFGSSGGQGSTAEGGYGGGLVYIQQDSGTFTHNGDIIADGAIGEIAEGLPVDERATGGGSGGSIYLNLTATFTGSTGTFSADGADGEENTSFTTYGGGGGGGRVAVLYSSDTSSFLSGLADSTVAVGGTGPSTAADGSTGSLYTAASSTPPDLTSAVTNDNDGNGQVDQIIATFDIDLNASTIAGSDFTVAGFTVSSASETSAGVVTIIVAESGSVDTDALPLVSVVASVESTDGGELTSDSVTATDAASPVASTFVYKDTDADGDIDRIDITFSENIAYDECEAGDFTFAGADAGSFAVSSCATSGDDLQLTVTGGPSDTTNVTITLAYTASNGTASSLDDSAGSAVADISATAVTDGAAPRSTGTQSYKDTDLDGKVDRVDITFSEDIAIDECEAGDYTIGGADAGTIAVASCAASSADLQLTISNTPSADTLLTFTVAYTAANGTASSLDDSAGNAAVDISALTLADAAAPAITGVTIEDVDTNGLIEKITVTWSENVDTNDSVAPVIADFGTITLPDGQAVSSATISDPAGSSNVVTLTVVAGQVTKNTAAGSTGINGISSEWTDGTNATSNPDDNEVITDSALPVFVSASFKDVTVVDGQVDRVDVTFSEAMTLSSYNTSDWSFPENGDMDLDDTNASASGSDILIVVDGNALTTGSSVTPTVLYTNNANRLTDAASNNVATFGAAEDLDDATAPILRTDGSNAPTYLDNDSNGAIDRVQLTFSESVTVVYSDGDWTATANGLTSFDTGAYLSGNGTTAILLTASAASNLTGVSGGTEPTLAFSASSGSITDGNSLTISSISAKTLVDGAAPVRVSHSYKDVNTDGTIDRFDVTFSEAIAYDECESGDFTVAGGDAGSLAVASCATSSADLQLTMSGGAANDTAIAVTLAYTASNGTASSLDDGTPGNAVGDLSATSLTDLAAPILVSYTYDDDNTDGTVDAVTFIFSEASTLSYTVSDFTVTANGLTSFSLDAGSVTNNGTANVSVPASASSNVTGVSGGTEPTISWSPTGGSISDGSNSISSISSTSATDNTAMILVSQAYKDTNSDGTVNRADLVFSENISLDECDAADYVFAGDDAGTIAVASCAVSTTDLQLTLSNTSANTTSLSITLAYDASEGTADSLKDSTGVVVTDLAAASLSDLAAPVLVSQQYVDSDTDGDIDRFDLTFSEDIAYDECDTADYTIAGSDVGSFAVSACATSNADLRLTVTGGPSNDTYAVLTLAYDASNGTADSLDDSAGNAVGDLTAASLTDGANPIATAKTYTDNSGNGTIDRVVLTLTEAVSLDECETEDFVFSGADAGSIAVVDSTGCSIATNVLTLTLSGAPANTTVLSVSLSYDASQGTADSFKDEGSAVLGDLSYSSLADLAIPIRVSSAYKDVTSVDGVVDRVDVTFSEPMTVSTCEVTDYTFGGADAGSFAVGSCTSSGNDIRYGATGGPSNDTNVTLTFAYDKTNETADSLVDASGNVLASLSAASVSDGAAPMLRTDNGSKSRYLDSDSDGQIDQVQLVFTESVTLTYDDADWTATANDLTSFDVSALESGSGSTTLVLTATAAAGLTGINDGTEPSLAFSDATNLTDGTNPLTSISQALTDGAAPVQSSYNYKDVDGNGTIDRIDVTFTENIDYDECDSGDYSFGGADAGSFAVSACAKSTTDLRLTVTGGVANDTNVTLTLSYDASASTADSLDDDDSNAVIDMTSLSLADSASPVLVSQSYKDINSDGTVDRADLTFSENIAIDECDVGDYAFAGTDSGTIAVQSAGCATSGDDLRLTLENATSLDTSLTFTIAYTASAGTANSLDDSSGNAVADISASSLADAAAPVLRTDGGNQPAYQDINSDGTIDRAILVFTETVTVTYSDGDWTATANDLTSFDTTGYTSGNGSETIYLTATAQAGLTGVGVGTEPSIAFTASTGSIVDPSANAISSFSASILADQADAVVLSQDYNDINGDGVVDRFDVMFSEVITLNECEAGDYTLGGADVGSFAVGSCATSGAELRLTVTGGPSSDTSLTLTLAYTAANGTADSIEDSASRAVSDISALTLADGAAPVPTTYSYLDVDADGVVDRLDVTFTENIAYDECEAGDYTIGGADAGSLAVSACATSGDDLRLTMTGGASDDTSLTLVFSYSQSAGTASSLDDSSGNYAVSITTESVSDGAAPVAISAEYLDTDADGTVNRVDVTFSEAVTLGSYVAGDWSFPEGSELTLVDTGASASSSEIQLTVSADSNETSHTTTPTVSYTNAGNRLSDGTNNTATFASAVNVSDAAAPVAISAEYLDTDVDGDVDRVDVTFTEAVTLSSYNASDWSFPVAGDVTLADTNASASSSEIQITVSSDSYETGHSTAPTVTYTNNSNRLSDGTNNTATFGSAITVSDAAAPVLRTDGSNAARYQDTDANGVIDAVQLIFTENTTLTYDDADWTATANSLSSFDVSAITSGSGSTTIVLTGAAAANTTGVSGATEPTLAFSDATNLTDGTNALTSISSFSLVDAASPIRVSQSYKDIDVDGTVDRLDVTFSENIAYDECDTADYTISGADVGSMAVSACAASTTDLRLTVTGATADDTSMTLTLAYTAANGTADSLDDGTPANAVGDLTASSISDAAAPVAISAEYLDTNTNGTVDRVDVTFTEAVTLDSYVAGDWSFPESSELTLADTGASASGSEIQIAVSADSNETGHTTAPTVSYTNAGNRLNDGTNNTATFASAITLTDGAGAMIISTTPTANEEDVASDTSIVLTFTEAINTATDSIGVTGHSGTFTTVWSSGDTVATLTSNKIYGSAEEITVTITTASDGSSNTFAGMISGTNPFSFTSITLGSSDASLSSAVPTGQYYTLTITQSGSSASISSISLGDSIDISWTDNGYVDSSDVYYRLSSTSAYTFIANTTSDELTWSVPTDEGGNSLKLKVVNGDNNSYSKTASISIASTDDSSSSDGDEGSESSSTSTVFESLVKTTEGSEVYALFPDGTRRVFINSTSYFTWEDTFSAVDTVEPEVMGDYRLTGLMLPRAGTVLVKIQSIPAVYYLEENPDNLYAPILRWIPDEETAIELFGTDWSKLVVDVAPTFFTKFTSPTSPITVEDDDWIDTDAIRTRESLAL